MRDFPRANGFGRGDRPRRGGCGGRHGALIGGDAPEIDLTTVAAKAALPLQQMITKFSALLPRRLA
jgi:hypothetical protein